MVMPKMNRLFTITAAEEEFEERAIPWRYSQYAVSSPPDGPSFISGPSAGGWAWYESAAAVALSSVSTASAVISFGGGVDYLVLGANSVTRDGEANSALPVPSSVLRGDALVGREVRIYSDYPSNNYLRFIADAREEFITSNPLFQQFFFVQIRRLTLQLVGNNFGFTQNGQIIVTVAGHTTASYLTESETYTGIWGEMREQQAIQNIQATGAGLVTSLQQSATLQIRYDARMVVGRTVTDDIGRRWFVESSRILRDRRFIEYTMTRTVPVT